MVFINHFAKYSCFQSISYFDKSFHNRKITHKNRTRYDDLRIMSSMNEKIISDC